MQNDRIESFFNIQMSQMNWYNFVGNSDLKVETAGCKWKHWILFCSKWILSQWSWRVCIIDANWPCWTLFDGFTWRIHLKTICWRLIFKASFKQHSGITFSCPTKSLPNVSSTSSTWDFWFFFFLWNNLFQCSCSGAHSSMKLITLHQSKFFGCFSRRWFYVNIGWAIILIIHITFCFLWSESVA